MIEAINRYFAEDSGTRIIFFFRKRRVSRAADEKQTNGRAMTVFITPYVTSKVIVSISFR